MFDLDVQTADNLCHCVQLIHLYIYSCWWNDISFSAFCCFFGMKAGADLGFRDRKILDWWCPKRCHRRAELCVCVCVCAVCTWMSHFGNDNPWGGFGCDTGGWSYTRGARVSHTEYRGNLCHVFSQTATCFSKHGRHWGKGTWSSGCTSGKMQINKTKQNPGSVPAKYQKQKLLFRSCRILIVMRCQTVLAGNKQALMGGAPPENVTLVSKPNLIEFWHQHVQVVISVLFFERTVELGMSFEVSFHRRACVFPVMWREVGCLLMQTLLKLTRVSFFLYRLALSGLTGR